MSLQVTKKESIQGLIPVVQAQQTTRPLVVVGPHQAPVQQTSPVVDFLRGIGAGVQQGLGTLGDVAIQGGGLLTQAGGGTTDAAIMLRNRLHLLKDINGNPIVGTSDVDQSATNIATGHGTAQDYAAVAGKGLETGADATMFLNPAGLAKDAVGGGATKTLIKGLIQNSALQGGASGASAGLETYGGTGDVKQALKAGLKSGVQSTAANLALGGAGISAGKLRGYTAKVLSEDANKQSGSIKVPGKPEETSPLNHFTTPESAEALKSGAAFDYTKTPVHGTGSRDLSDNLTGRMVADSKPALYLSLDDKSWQTASKVDPSAEKVTLPTAGDALKFQQDGGTVGFNYKTQQYEGIKNGTIKTNLVPVQYHVNPSSRTLVIDSVDALKHAQQLTGKRSDDPQFWTELRKQYDVIDIKNVAKTIAETSKNDDNKLARGFFGSAKADQKIVLNPDVVSTKPFSLTQKPKVSIKQSLSPTPKQSKIADALGIDKRTLQQAINNTPDQQKIANARIRANNSPLPTQSMLAKDNVPFKPKYESPRTPEENTALNPVKTTIPDVSPGNSEQIRVNSQLASEPIRYEANLGARLARKLSPTEKQDFGQMVEGTIPAESRAAKDAVDAYRRMTNRAHSINQSLGGNTNYKQNYFHREWDLSDPKMAEKYDQALQKASYVDPHNFKGINAQPQAFKTIAEGEAAGFHLLNKDDPSKAFENYGNSASYALRQQAIRKGIDDADINATSRPVTFDLGNGESVPVSRELAKGLKGVSNHEPTDIKIVKGLRAANKATKQVVLGGSQFHTINIGALRAGPELALSGHPIRAAKGVGSMFLSQLSPKFNDHLRIRAAQDGLPEFAARIGMPYGSNDFATSGVSSLAGHGLIFGKAMPAIQDQMLRSIKADFDKKGISYDSPEAHQAGVTANKVLGFLNTTVQNLDSRVQRVVSDWIFAPQFTRSGLELFRDAFRGGLGGRYARAAIVGNVLATTLAIGAIGAATGQKSDDIQDLLLRALIDPAIPTPFKDDKGNTIKFRTPGTLTSMVAKLLGITLQRGQDGHLGVSWNPTNVPSSIVDFMRSHLSELPATALKVATNTNYAGKPLYDPNAGLGTKIAQGATSTATGLLPIGAQSLPYVPGVKGLFPKDVQDVLNANTPGTNPILKSLASSLGATATTDQTVGQGLSTKRYYDQVDQGKQGLDRQAADAYDLWTGSKKNPVTGAYDVQPNANDARVKATALLQNPDALDHIITMNQNLTKEGEKTDPLWGLSKDQITKYLQYQAMPPGSADKTDWINKNPWYEGDPNNPNDGGLVDQRNTFFSSLPPGDPNKPQLNIQYPDPTAAVQAVQTAYDSLAQTDKGTFIQAHPELVDQWAKQADYTNKMRDALGYSPLKNYPEPTDDVNKFITQYSAADKGTKAGLRNANPSEYQKMIGYFDSVDLYNINKTGAVDQLQGEPDSTSNQNKAISNLAKDIYQNPATGAYSIQPAGWMNGLSNSSSSSSSSHKSHYKLRIYNKPVPHAKEVDIPKVSLKKGTTSRGLASKAKKKVSFKKSLV